MAYARTLARIALAALIAAACTPPANHVQLTLSSSGHVTPLLCRAGMTPLGRPHERPMPDGGPPPMDAGPPPDGMTTPRDSGFGSGLLIERARAAGGVRVVVDYFTISGGVPGCLPDQILGHCAANCCTAVPRARACVDVPLVDAGALTGPELADYIIRSLHGRVLTPSAPEGYVIVRMVATVEQCADFLPTGFDSAQLVGCAYSCPVVLSAVQGTLALGLPTLNDQCENWVDSCAHVFDQLATTSCIGADQ